MPLVPCVLDPDAGLELPAGAVPPVPTTVAVLLPTPLPAALVPQGSVLLLLERDDGNQDGATTLTESGTSISSDDDDGTVSCEPLRCC